MASTSLKEPRPIYETTKSTINETIKHFEAFVASLNDVCGHATSVGRSLQSLEEMTVPQVIGDERVNRTSARKFKNSAPLTDALDTFSKILITYSEKIKTDALDNFDNFIMQAIIPSDDELKAIHEHNSQIVNEFRESFFSLYNHFMVLAAELLEKFLICANCSTPIGFPHQPLCLTKSLSRPNVWKKMSFDDKFITFSMNFCFDDLINPGSRKNILAQIASSCLKQYNTSAAGHNKPSIPLMTKSWPVRWLRGEKNRSKSNDKTKYLKARIIHVPTHPRLFKPSIWTPKPEHSSAPNYRVPPPGFNFSHEKFD